MFFEDRATFRLTEEQKKAIKEIFEEHQDKYENVSHFVRCAILKLIKEEQKLMKIKKN